MLKLMAFLRPRKRLFMSVLAEEQNTDNQDGSDNKDGGNGTDPNPPAQPPQPNGTVAFEELIAKARKEEKDKLYPQIEKLKESNNSHLLVIAERDKEIETLKKERDQYKAQAEKLEKDQTDGTKANTKVSELTSENAKLQRDLDALQKKYDNDINTVKLNAYRDKKISEAQGALIPELVTGTTEEEINASIEVAKQRYAEIQASAYQGIQMPKANPVQTAITQQTVSDVDIANMSMEEWAEFRKKSGII